MKKTKKIPMLLMVAIAFALLFGMQLTAHAEVKKGSCGMGVNWTLDTETGVMNITGNGSMNDWNYKSSPWRSYYSKIKRVYISEGVTSIGTYAFVEHYYLEYVQMPNSIKVIGDRAFNGCSKLTAVTWPDKLEVIGEGAFNSSAIQSVELKGNVRVVEYAAFGYCRQLSSIKIADGLTTVGKMSFEYCESLKKVLLPDSVTSIGELAFSNAKKLTTVRLSKNMTEIPRSAFNGCASLISINIPSSIESIGVYAFSGCKSLECVVLPEGLKTIGSESFINCAIKHIKIPASVTNINKDAFGRCNNLEKIAILNKDTVIAPRSYLETLGVLGTTTVYGYSGSTAQVYAVNRGFSFEYITANNLWEDTMIEPSPFDDVKNGTYYFEPVIWAVDNGITSGLKPDLFGPEEACTRGQIVTFLWRTMGEPPVKSTNNPFKDVNASHFYYKAVLWAVENNITAGLSSTKFGPEEPCTRGQIVTFLWRTAGQPKASSASHVFRDIKAGQYYYDAVLWAVENGITAGLTSNQFGPESPCTRGQIVTFLYRAYKQ